MLLFKRHLLPLITSGKKRQTIRLWKSPRVRPGQIAFAPGLGRLLITGVDQLPSLASLTAADARADGFPTKKALLAEIRRLYNPLPQDRRIFRIQFQYPAPPDRAGPPGPADTVGGRGVNKRPALPNRKSKIKNRKSIPLKQQRQTLRHFLVALAPKHRP